jgi:hypothetical protein
MKHECVFGRLKVVANRPGLTTVRCKDCGKTTIWEYKSATQLDALKKRLKYTERKAA